MREAVRFLEPYVHLPEEFQATTGRINERDHPHLVELPLPRGGTIYRLLPWRLCLKRFFAAGTCFLSTPTALRAVTVLGRLVVTDGRAVSSLSRAFRRRGVVWM